jgi:hypothetical protein
MHKHREAQEGRVELNIGGYSFQTLVQTLWRIPHTFFDAYFSGRYAHDMCDDGSTFVDRDGEHFGDVLEYMRDGVVSVAETGARPSMSLLRALKREFGYYCIELVAEPVTKKPEAAFVMGRLDESDETLSSTERYDTLLGQWSPVAAMGIARIHLSACVLAGEIYLTGGQDHDDNCLSSVEKDSPLSDTWSAVAPPPGVRVRHGAVTVGSAMYVLGGDLSEDDVHATDSVITFDSTQGTWSEVAPMPGARCLRRLCHRDRHLCVWRK